MSAHYDLHLKCDAVGCGEEAGYASTGDTYAHAAAADGWRWTAVGRALCKQHAQSEWPGSFARHNGHEYPHKQEAAAPAADWLE